MPLEFSVSSNRFHKEYENNTVLRITSMDLVSDAELMFINEMMRIKSKDKGSMKITDVGIAFTFDSFNELISCFQRIGVNEDG